MINKIAFIVLLALLCGCENVHLLVHVPPPIQQTNGYNGNHRNGRKDTFYQDSVLTIVNTSRYHVQIIDGGTEYPGYFSPDSQREFRIKNKPHQDVRVNMIAIAWRSGRIVGRVERTFTFNGDGRQHIERWTLNDRSFNHRR